MAKTLLATLAIALGSSWGSQAQDEAPPWTPLEGLQPAQPRLCFRGDASTSILVSWSTLEEGERHRVHYDTKARKGALERYAEVVECHRNGSYTPNSDEDSTTGFYHHAWIEGLEPDTTYWLTMASDDATYRELHFRTAPAEDEEFGFLYGGDSRSNHKARQAANVGIAKITDEVPELLAYAHGGDYVYNGRYWSQWSTWLHHHELTIADSGRVLPLIAARGNHDTGPLLDEVFDNPGGRAKNWYTTQLGPELALVTLNSETVVGGNQAEWLDAELAARRPENRWLLTLYHRPLYPAIKSPGSAKDVWVPLFEKHDLDLSIECDGHSIKRTVPIRGGKQDPTGVVYIGEGGLGAPQRTAREAHWYLESPGMVSKGHHITRLDVTAESIRMRVLRVDENAPGLPTEVADDHAIRPRD